VDGDTPPPVEGATGSPVGRRVVLGMVALGGIGVLLGSRVNSALTALSAKDPTGLTDLIPGSGRFRIYSVVSRVAEVEPADYRLRVDGLVERPLELGMADLAALPQTAMTKDVQCVTGWRVEDVDWSGVLLADLLDHVGAARGAGAVLFGSSDGVYTESLTMEQARRADVLVATGMAGGPVSHDHGGPVRLYVAPMYFYKSLKWLDRITVAEDVVPGYWEVRGYDVDAWVGESNGRRDEQIA
jgi:DMSO/TMAO reductase YedYZ molybdopterin-dependent catalytic subunit